MSKKRNAMALLREYDALDARLRILRRETQKAVTDYGVEVGIWGFGIDKFRLHLQMEEERAKKEERYGTDARHRKASDA